MEDLINEYDQTIIIISIFILIIAIGGFKGTRSIISKCLVLFAFITFLFNSKIAVALDDKNQKENVLHKITQDDIDPWVSDTTIPIEQAIENTKEQMYEVQEGDNLYSIAVKYVSDKSQVNKLWLEIISVNTQNIKSKNPNLIFPGEQIIIPQL